MVSDSNRTWLQETVQPNVAVVFTIAMSLATAGCGSPADPGKEAVEKEAIEKTAGGLPMVLDYDFRKAPPGQLPEGFVFRNVTVADHVRTVPGGLEIKVEKPYRVRGGRGVGVQTAYGLRGDFDIAVSYDAFKAETPVQGHVGFNLCVKVVDGPIRSISRIVRVSANGISWQPDGYAASTADAGTMRFVRVGQYLYYLWSPETQAKDFKILEKIDFGTMDLQSTYVDVFTADQSLDVETRVLDWRIRGQREDNPVADPTRVAGETAVKFGEDAPVGKSRSRLWIVSAIALLVALLLGAAIVISRRRRRREEKASKATS